MAWDIKKEAKYTLYTPIDCSEKSLLEDFSKLPHSTDNKIVICNSVAFSEALKKVISSVYEQHFEQQKSMIVVIAEKESLAQFEELFVAVPTISEAIDYIYMEELERNF